MPRHPASRSRTEPARVGSSRRPSGGPPPRAWFDDARLGVFIHFGLYALLGGNENDYGRGAMTKSAYERMAARFNPRRFDADAWVRLFREAGARYAVLTTKHGEGFCLWDTDQTAYKITNTPFGRDLVREYADACRRGGLRVGFYFSICDWHYAEPGEGTREGGAFPGYVEAQLRELLTRYGRVDEIWFDGGDPRLPPVFIRRMVRLIHRLQPSCVVTDRGLPTGGDATRAGDFATPERFIPVGVAPRHRAIECCDAMGRKGWGFHRDQSFWSAPELVSRLCRCAAIGANYLLNVEPMPDGRIRPECAARLRAMGRWLSANRDAIFAARGCPVVPLDPADGARPPQGVATRRARTIYAHLFRWPSSDELLLPGVTGPRPRATLAGRTAGSAVATPDGLLLRGLPPASPCGLPAVLRVDFAGEPRVDPAPPGRAAGRPTASLPGDTLVLAPEAAVFSAIDGVPYHQIKTHRDGRTAIGMVIRHGAALAWTVDAARAGRYEVWAHLGAMPSQAGSAFAVEANGHALRGKTEPTGHYDTPRWFRLGALPLKRGAQRVTWRLLDLPGGCSADIHGVVLRRAPTRRAAGIDRCPPESPQVDQRQGTRP
jgi:alpha-L-fucosidase